MLERTFTVVTDSCEDSCSYDDTPGACQREGCFCDVIAAEEEVTRPYGEDREELTKYPDQEDWWGTLREIGGEG